MSLHAAERQTRILVDLDRIAGNEDGVVLVGRKGDAELRVHAAAKAAGTQRPHPARLSRRRLYEN